MLTKKQKIEKVEESNKLLDESKSLVFVDFGGVNVHEFEKLRRSLREIGAKIKVIKKKLLAIALKNKKIDFNPEQYELQMAAVFAPKEVYEVAGPVFRSKIKILGGYDLVAKEYIDATKVKMLGQLPSREVLLGQLVGMLTVPIRMFMRVLEEKSRK